MKQYRVVILGNIQNYYSHFLYGSLEGSIRCGTWAKTVQLVNRNLKDIKEEINFIKPHFIFCHMVFGPLRKDVLNYFNTLRKKGTKIIYHMGDARKTPRYSDFIGDYVDLGLVNNLEYEKFSSIWGIPCIHWPYMCFYQKGISDIDNRYKSGLSFTGELDSNKHHGPRKIFIQQLKNSLPLKIFPTAETGNTRFQTAELSSSANGILGMQMGLDLDGYQDVRPFQYIGAGAVYFHDKHPSIDLFFEDGVHYVSYERNNINSLKNKYNKFQNNNKIRNEGFKFCQRYHSTKERIQSVINYFEGKESLPIYKKELI